MALREARDAEAEADFLDEFGDDAAKFAARAAADAAKATAEEAEREARAAAQRSEMLRSEARVAQAERKEDTRTASFRSASPSARSYIRPSPTPGVGSYDPHDSPNKVRTRRSHHNFKPGTSACTMQCIAMYNPMVYSACYLLAICSLSACQPRRLYIPHASLSLLTGSCVYDDSTYPLALTCWFCSIRIGQRGITSPGRLPCTEHAQVQFVPPLVAPGTPCKCIFANLLLTAHAYP